MQTICDLFNILLFTTMIGSLLALSALLAGRVLGMPLPLWFGVCCAAAFILPLHVPQVWLVSLMLRSLLRFPELAYFYPFIRFAGVDDDIWLVNKGVLCLIGLGLWGLIYWTCRCSNAKPISRSA